MKLTEPGLGQASYWAIITGAMEAKAYELPDEVVAAVVTRQRIHDLAEQVVAVPRMTLAEQILAAARSGAPLPGTTVESLDAIAAEAGRARARQLVFEAAYGSEANRMAREIANDSVRSTIRVGAEDILARLKAAHTQTVADAKACADRIGEHGMTDAFPYEPPSPAVAKARTQFRAHAGRYGHLRVARSKLTPFLGEPALDVGGQFAEVRNMGEIYIRSWSDPQPAPWDSAGAPDLRLFMLIEAQADLWMPSPDEQDEAWTAGHPDARLNRPAIVGRTPNSRVDVVNAGDHVRG